MSFQTVHTSIRICKSHDRIKIRLGQFIYYSGGGFARVEVCKSLFFVGGLREWYTSKTLMVGELFHGRKRLRVLSSRRTFPPLCFLVESPVLVNPYFVKDRPCGLSVPVRNVLARHFGCLGSADGTNTDRRPSSRPIGRTGGDSPSCGRYGQLRCPSKGHRTAAPRVGRK